MISKMEVHIVSREAIKPSSSTPRHLRIFELSLLDQLIPAPYAPLVLFYPNQDGASRLEILQRIAMLKQSLSETLTDFYPLAGAVIDDLSIDCSDQGAFFATAEVNLHLSDFLEKIDLDAIPGFLPCGTGLEGSAAGTQVTNIQITIFKCGGIALGLCISHKILDGTALRTFLKGWTLKISSRKEAVYPCFDANSPFPANDLWLRDSSMVMWGSLFRKGNGVTKRFVFDASAISNLKIMAETGSGPGQSPTRVEIVSAFLWKRMIAASAEVSGSKKPSLLTHIVNLRKRSSPAMPEHSLGNLIWLASAKDTAKHELGLASLLGRVRKSIAKINHDYVKKLRGDEGSSLMFKTLKEIGEFGSKESVDFFGFTSWCKLGFYETDFGWGKPVWVSTVGSKGPVFMNLMVLMDTRCGNGIEAWVTLDEEEMDVLKVDQELLKFSLFDPSPLEVGN